MFDIGMYVLFYFNFYNLYSYAKTSDFKLENKNRFCNGHKLFER